MLAIAITSSSLDVISLFSRSGTMARSFLKTLSSRLSLYRNEQEHNI